MTVARHSMKTYGKGVNPHHAVDGGLVTRHMGLVRAHRNLDFACKNLAFSYRNVDFPLIPEAQLELICGLDLFIGPITQWCTRMLEGEQCDVSHVHEILIGTQNGLTELVNKEFNRD